MSTGRANRRPLQNISNSLTSTGSATATVKGHQNGIVKVMPDFKSFVVDPTKPTTPYERHMARLENVINNHYNPQETTWKEIRAPIEEVDPEWNEERAKDLANMDRNRLTHLQVRRVQVIILTPHRQETFTVMEKLIFGNQYGQTNKVFTPSFAFTVLRAYEGMKRQYSNTDCHRMRFDLLFGFTYHILKSDYWMSHHARGWGGEKMVAGLASRWKELLREFSVDELGLDLHFSFPAVRWLLKRFKEKVEGVETYGDPQMVFSYV